MDSSPLSISLDQLKRRDAELTALVAATSHLLARSEPMLALGEAVRAFGHATGQDRISIFQYRQPHEGPAILQHRLTWRAAESPGDPGETEVENPVQQSISCAGLEDMLHRLSSGQPVIGTTRELEMPGVKPAIAPLIDGAISYLRVPIRLHETIWGLISFDDMHKCRFWDASQISVRMALADSVSSAQTRWAVSDELKVARDAAESASRAKSDFLAQVSHELRTPLNGIIGLTDLLLKSTLLPEQTRFATLAHSSAQLLLQLINDLLDFSKIEAGKLDLESVPFDLNEAAQQAIQLLHPRAQEKQIALTCSVDPNLPRWVEGDPLRFRQVLLNLLSNAVKFTHRGSVTLAIDHLAQPYGDGEQFIRVSVTDTGIGIPPNAIDRLFKSFTQVEASTTRKYGGTGLGLAICKNLVELMGGRIDVQSTPGVGSTFSFEIPLRSAATHSEVDESAVTATPALSPSSSGASILLADDNEVNQLVASEYLCRAGHQVTIVGDGILAVEAAQSGRHQLILMDCQMPNLDGIAATQRIREWEKALGPASQNRIPIIALTAGAVDGDRERCLAAGMDAFITKPIQPDQLLALVGSFLTPNQSRQADPIEQNPQSVDEGFDALLNRCNQDREFMKTLIDLFIAQSDRDLIAIDQAVKQGSLQAAASAAHSLKGSAGHIGATALRELAAQIEHCGREADAAAIAGLLETFRENANQTRTQLQQYRTQITQTLCRSD